MSQQTKPKSIFDVDFLTFIKIKKEFPENQPQKSKKKVFGMEFIDFITAMKKYVAINQESENKLYITIDRLSDNRLTWREFMEWFQRQGDVRDQVHTAQINQMGITRVSEGDTFHLTNKRVEPKVDIILPVYFKELKKHLIFMVFENKNAIFINQETMMQIKNLRFQQVYQVPMSKRFEGKKKQQRQVSQAIPEVAPTAVDWDTTLSDVDIPEPSTIKQKIGKKLASPRKIVSSMMTPDKKMGQKQQKRKTGGLTEVKP